MALDLLVWKQRHTRYMRDIDIKVQAAGVYLYALKFVSSVIIAARGIPPTHQFLRCNYLRPNLSNIRTEYRVRVR